MKKFCPKCGKTIEKGVLCDACKQGSLEYKKVKIKLCPSMKYFYHGKWTSFKDLHSLSEKLVHESLKKKVKVLKGLETYVDLLEKPGLKKDIDVIISVNGEDFVLPISVEVTYSPGINKLGSTYFEGILQLRNAPKEVKDHIKRYFAKNKILINKIDDKNKSADYYFVNKHHIVNVALKVIRNFGGFMTQNPKLFSRNKQTSKDIYRLNVQLTIPDFAVNDVVEVDNSAVLLRKTSKEISGFDLVKKKHKTFQYNARIAETIKVLERQKTTVTRIKPDLAGLDPDTYQEAPLNNPLNIKLKPGQNIIIVKFRKRFYVLK